MEMLQTYQGQVKEGQCVLSERVSLPENAPFILTIFDRVAFDEFVPKRGEGIKRFFNAMDTITDEPITDEDLARLANNRISFKRDLGAV